MAGTGGAIGKTAANSATDLARCQSPIPSFQTKVSGVSRPSLIRARSCLTRIGPRCFPAIATNQTAASKTSPATAAPGPPGTAAAGPACAGPRTTITAAQVLQRILTILLASFWSGIRYLVPHLEQEKSMGSCLSGSSGATTGDPRRLASQPVCRALTHRHARLHVFIGRREPSQKRGARPGLGSAQRPDQEFGPTRCVPAGACRQVRAGGCVPAGVCRHRVRVGATRRRAGARRRGGTTPGVMRGACRRREDS